jgi:uncharacterized protein (TIGR02588 family)
MSEDQSKNKVAPRTTAEWVSLGVALLLLAGVIGIVISLWLKATDNQIQFEIERQPIYEQEGQFYLPITITNSSDKAAQLVTVEGKLTVEDKEEITTTTFDFVPPRSKVQGVLIFNNNPKETQVRITSFQVP